MPLASGEKSMFEVGKTYTVKMIEGDSEVEYGGCEVLEVNLPLIKITGIGSGPVNATRPTILNTCSRNFISASEVEWGKR
jgi:hypothetical protein